MEEPKKFKKVFLASMVCIALILAIVSNICVYAFGEVTNGSVTAFLLEEYKDNTTIIVYLMLANTAVSLSVLFTYPIQLFPVIELVGPKATALWYMIRHGGKKNDIDALDEDDEEHDLAGFGPLPTLPEHEDASLGSYNNEHIYDKHEKKINDDDSVGSDDVDELVQDRKKIPDLGLRNSMMSNITEVFPKMSIPGDSLSIRVILVVLTYCVAVVVPNVQALISLAGAVAGSSTALLIPPILELALIEHLETSAPTPAHTASPKPTPPSFLQTTISKPSFLRRLMRHDLSGKYWKKKLKNYVLFWVGILFFIVGAYASIADIVSIWLGKGE